ncbi:L,D-transpeptidase [Plantactinospora sp. KBS50]|uniref:L,D-transpeptidase n=1 Tax=Plantactinospora sp. KBS50 TaxID=2024580 RepID=UPI001E5175D6|nr:L,D-transpeptidase [Plantactinospora sp. KBS50]
MAVVAPGPASPAPRRRWWWLPVVAVILVALLGGLAAVTLAGPRNDPARWATPPTGGTPAAPTTAAQESIEAAPAPDWLPVVDYGPAPGGFPADPDPHSTTRLGTGLHPSTRVAAYDAPGGRPRAFLAPTLSGVPLTVPIVQTRAGWAAVLLPSVNRTIAWVPPGGWETVALRDLIVVQRRSHRLIWYRDDAQVRSWPVTLGQATTPTPLGRTFILGRSRLAGKVYADTDVFALGAVPDDPGSVPTSLRGAHTGIHTWYTDAALGRDVSDGCIRLTRSGQRQLLAELIPGTEVVVVDR